MKYLANIVSLLAETTNPFNDYTAKLLKLVTDLLTPIFAVLATVGIVWAIVLGVQYMKAESTDKKEEAKKRMINVIVGTAIMLVMVIILIMIAQPKNLNAIVDWLKGEAA